METSEDIRIAKDLVQVFIKAKKTLKLYPENNPIYAKTLDNILLMFVDFFNYKNELTLKIKQNDIFFGSEQVYHNPGKDNNLALFFFKDGVRELSFKKGLPKEELENFLKIIALDFDREAVDDDIVTLLWEKDFKSIKYIADEAFLLEDEDYEIKALAEIKNKAPDVDMILKAYTDSFNAKDIRDISTADLTDRDIQLLINEKTKDIADKTGKLLQILFEMLSLAENTTEIEDVIHAFNAIILYAIKYRDFSVFVNIIKKTKETAENPSTPDNIKNQLNLLLSIVNSEEIIKQVGGMLDSEEKIDENILDEYLGLLGKNAVTGFISVLGTQESIHGRKKIINILIRLGETDISVLAAGLNDPRWYVVRNIIYILGQIGNNKAVEYLLPMAKHTDAKVRKEIANAFGDFKNPASIRILKDYLNDADAMVRKAAVKALSSLGVETVKGIIIDTITEKNFSDRSFDEKREFFQALSCWNNTDTVAFLINYLQKKSFLNLLQDAESKACAAYALGLLGNKDALPALYKLRGSKNSLLRDYVSAAIKRIEYGS